VISFLNGIDRSLFLFLNGLHTPAMDPVMYYASKGMLWLPLYLVFLFLVVKEYKWQTLLVIIVTTIMIAVSDQLANLSKDFFQRLRPSNEPGLTVHLVNAYKGGLYGFYSAHASNTFALAVFLVLLLGKSSRWFIIVAIPWAVLMSYTRIYLGVHYPGDTITGILIGSLLGFFAWKTFLTLSEKVEARFEKHTGTGGSGKG
jgi:undecaprenyl-diphosphatase